MKLNIILAAALLSLSSTVMAKDKVTLNEGVDADVKAAVESAQTLAKQAKAEKLEWFWAKGAAINVKGKKLTTSKLMTQAIKLANDGKNDEAKKIASFIEKTVTAAIKQAEIAKNAGPRF